ncbi:MAG: ATP-binding cassette domain-containing protein [Spirochaetales bacterium]|nr:ATP-binding cassette domain-containing protein [Spirochaetales bacterium]
MDQKDQALTIKEVAKYLNISPQMVYNLIKQGELEAFKIGSAVRILFSDLQAYVKKQKHEYANRTKKYDNHSINTDDSLMVLDNVCVDTGSFSLTDISFSFPRESILAILGPSGSGKTLLLYGIAGLEELTAGAVFVGKKRIDMLKAGERRIGFVFQDYALFPHLSARENIMFPFFSSKQKQAKKEDLEKALKELQLDTAYLPFKPEELPEGMKQLVAIGREKIRDVDLFLMDEPMSRLDKDKQHKIRMIIKRILTHLKKTTIICVNDPHDALALSNYVVILIDGRIKMFGETQHVYNNPQYPEVMEIFSCYGVNTYPVRIRNGQVSAFPHNIQKKDGEYMLYFRSEEIKLIKDGKGIDAKIIREHFLDGKNKLIECIASDNTKMQLLVPLPIKENVRFVPANPLFVPVE